MTGSSGAVGSALCAGLPAAGWLVRQIDRVPPAVVPEDPRDSVVGDVFDPATLQRAIRGCSAVVHLAAVPGEASIEEIAASHLVGMSTGLEAIAAREAGMEVLGISLVTNFAAGMTGEPLNHEEVLATGRDSAVRMGDLLAEVMARL